MQIHSKYNQNFLKALERLNENQLKAVNQIEGPVLVIAGPGTGKTQILAARIGKILLDTDTQPHNILCLTYTDAGAVAMRKRLFDFIGPEAYRVNIYTFHAFCNDIIQENLDYFGKLELDAISDLERIELFRKLVDSFDKDHPLKRFRGDVYYEINRLQSLFSTMKREYWSPEYISKKIDEFKGLVECCEPHSDYYKAYKYVKKYLDKAAGSFKPAFTDLCENLEKLRAAVNEYPKYQQMMRQKSRYDFDDMIIWVLEAFKTDDQFLLNYQERYQYVLVDEYQDTSGAQNELINLLISYWEKPNVFVVGDDDQSIFRFQGAKIENIKKYIDSYTESLFVVMLTDNYRSTQHILDTSRELINNKSDDQKLNLEGLNKNLISRNSRFSDPDISTLFTGHQEKLQDFAQKTLQFSDHLKDIPSYHQHAGTYHSILNKFITTPKEFEAILIDNGVIPHPKIIAYPTQFHEFAFITNEIDALIKTGVPPDEIAVIYKEHRSGQELSRYFQLKGIPVSARRKVNILTEPFGRKMINLLRYLALETEFSYSGDELLFEIMHYDFYSILPMDIARISVEVNNYNKYHKDKTSIRAKIYEIARKTGQTLFDTDSSKQIQRLSDDLEFWIKEAQNITLQNLFEKIMVRGGILAYILKSGDKTWFMQVLSSLFNFLKEESRKKPDIQLKGFVELLDLLEENDLSLELHQTIFNEKGVNFLTCHGSKGLEFEHVYLIGSTKNIWEKKRKNTTGQYKFPDTIFSSLTAGSEEEELRRLFYVAITRAKKYLHISFPEQDTKGKPLESTVFIGEILASTQLEIIRPDVTEEILTDFFVLQFTEQEKPTVGLMDKEYITHLLENYALSVTHLNNYLDCPLKFYFQNLVQVPCGKSDTLTFGSAVHSALNKLFRALPDNDNQFKPLSQLMDDFNWYMTRNREAFTTEQFKRRSEYGGKILPEFYNKYVDQWEKITVTEYAIKNVEVDGIPVKGVLDKLEFKGNQANVVDYKTGSYERAKAKFKRPDEKLPQGGDYWRQAVFYKLLVDNDRRKDWQVISTEFDFIEPDKGEYIKEKVIIRPEDLDIVREQIKQTYSKILNHEFTEGCGKEDCQWCTFVRSNFQQPENLLENVAEEE